jgi:hypothetical protein
MKRISLMLFLGMMLSNNVSGMEIQNLSDYIQKLQTYNLNDQGFLLSEYQNYINILEGMEAVNPGSTYPVPTGINNFFGIMVDINNLLYHAPVKRDPRLINQLNIYQDILAKVITQIRPRLSVIPQIELEKKLIQYSVIDLGSIAQFFLRFGFSPDQEMRKALTDYKDFLSKFLENVSKGMVTMALDPKFLGDCQTTLNDLNNLLGITSAPTTISLQDKLNDLAASLNALSSAI